jgi:hypothetical protein
MHGVTLNRFKVRNRRSSIPGDCGASSTLLCLISISGALVAESATVSPLPKLAKASVLVPAPHWRLRTWIMRPALVAASANTAQLHLFENA